LETISEKYLHDIRASRSDKRFIYNLAKTTIKDDQTRFDCWDEYEFESTRTFNSLFFDGKDELMERIQFFLNNKDWYCKIGIPYSIGIGLHGPPGTGKTSLIKSIANYTKRDIIILSLKLIKTKSQLEQFFFENTYNRANKPGSKSFDKKIIVFEDIDCIGDIILNRDREEKKDKSTMEDVFKTMDSAMYSKLVSSKLLVEDKITSDDKITLDDILNMWDGIRETPGRILIMTSNHYHELDPALIRPGRIDISHEMKNASHKTIRDLYEHLFDHNIDEASLLLINEYFYSPAELINIYIFHNDATRFLERLMLNQKV
jgi:chaperone BCS1